MRVCPCRHLHIHVRGLSEWQHSMWLALCGPSGIQCMAATSSVSQFLSWPSGAATTMATYQAAPSAAPPPAALLAGSGDQSLLCGRHKTAATRSPPAHTGARLVHSVSRVSEWSLWRCAHTCLPGFGGQCSCTHLEPCILHVLLLCRGQCSHKEGPQGVAVPGGTV